MLSTRNQYQVRFFDTASGNGSVSSTHKTIEAAEKRANRMNKNWGTDSKVYYAQNKDLADNMPLLLTHHK